jgi:Kae1-associated kinase Bud32
MALIAKGAEAELRMEKLLGKEVVVKERVRKDYREAQLDESLRRLRTRNEARLLHEAKRLGVLCPIVYSVSNYELAMDFLDGELLYDLLKKEKGLVVLEKVGEALARLHEGDIVHGDFTTSNVIVEEGKPWLFDFGLGGFTKEAEEKAIDVLLMKRSLMGRERYAAFLKGYAKYGEAKKILKQLEEIERRGRYVVRAMAEGKS